jgi:hypothetical protein
MNKKPKIFIGIPCYNGLISASTFVGLVEVFKWCLENKIEYHYSLLTTDSLVSRARNTLATQFLDAESFSHLFFVDADIGFSINNFTRLLEYNKDMACGIYPSKKINWNRSVKLSNDKITPDTLLNYNVNFIDPSNIIIDNLGFAQIQEAATGFLLIKRKVFETLKDKYPNYKFKARSGSPTEGSDNNYDFFRVGTYLEKDGTNVYLSEDYYFSRLWLESGGEIYADTVSSLKHLGNYTYEGSISKLMTQNEK